MNNNILDGGVLLIAQEGGGLCALIAVALLREREVVFPLFLTLRIGLCFEWNNRCCRPEVRLFTAKGRCGFFLHQIMESMRIVTLRSRVFTKKFLNDDQFMVSIENFQYDYSSLQLISGDLRLSP